jgi:hypothetical protein
MVAVVAAASPDNTDFAVINFGIAPPIVVMTPGFDGGNVVDCYGTVVAVGANSGLSVALFDISWPETPVQTGMVQTGFQIGSISIYGSWVLTGEYEGSRVSLIDISDPTNPYVLSVSDCAPLLNIISSVALRSPTITGVAPKLTAVVSGDNNSVILDFEDPPIGAVPAPLLYNAWPSDFDGWTAAVANGDGGIYAYSVSGNDATQLVVVPYQYLTWSVAVAEIPSGGYYVAASSQRSFTVFGYPPFYPSGSITTSLPGDISSTGIAVKFLNNPAVAPFLTVADVNENGVFVYLYMLQAETGGDQGTIVEFFTPIPMAQVALSTAYLPTLGITWFEPVVPPCFIVSAATGSRDSVEVRRLQQIRAGIAETSVLGAQLIREILREYYRFSQGIAAVLEKDEGVRTAVLEIVVRPLVAWFNLAFILGHGPSDQKTVEHHAQAVLDACPGEPGDLSMAALFEAIRSGNPVAENAPRSILSIADKANSAARLPYASWAIFDPLVRVWSLRKSQANVVDEVAQWLGAAPLEGFSPPSDQQALDGELNIVAGFFDFHPGARRQLGTRLAAAWPLAASALEKHGFI